MFRKMLLNSCFALVVLFVAGCGASYGPITRPAPSKILELDDGFDFSVTIEKGKVLALVMRQPRNGHTLTGAAFDPGVLRLDHYLEYDEGGRRARYMFTTLENGLTDVLIKMEPAGGGNAQVYKRVSVNVGTGTGLF